MQNQRTVHLTEGLLYTVQVITETVEILPPKSRIELNIVVTGSLHEKGRVPLDILDIVDDLLRLLEPDLLVVRPVNHEHRTVYVTDKLVVREKVLPVRILDVRQHYTEPGGIPGVDDQTPDRVIMQRGEKHGRPRTQTLPVHNNSARVVAEMVYGELVDGFDVLDDPVVGRLLALLGLVTVPAVVVRQNIYLAVKREVQVRIYHVPDIRRVPVRVDYQVLVLERLFVPDVDPGHGPFLLGTQYIYPEAVHFQVINLGEFRPRVILSDQY